MLDHTPCCFRQLLLLHAGVLCEVLLTAHHCVATHARLRPGFAGMAYMARPLWHCSDACRIQDWCIAPRLVYCPNYLILFLPEKVGVWGTTAQSLHHRDAVTSPRGAVIRSAKRSGGPRCS
eukprot:350178-Chlamydomonas_euryale.AAC.2